MDKTITAGEVFARVATVSDVEPALTVLTKGLWSSASITAGQFVMTMRRLAQASS